VYLRFVGCYALMFMAGFFVSKTAVVISASGGRC